MPTHAAIAHPALATRPVPFIGRLAALLRLHGADAALLAVIAATAALAFAPHGSDATVNALVGFAGL